MRMIPLIGWWNFMFEKFYILVPRPHLIRQRIKVGDTWGWLPKLCLRRR